MAGNRSNLWTPAEDATLRELHARRVPYKLIAKALPGRNCGAVRGRVWWLGLAKAKPLAVLARCREVARLVDAGLSNREVADRLGLAREKCVQEALRRIGRSRPGGRPKRKAVRLMAVERAR